MVKCSGEGGSLLSIGSLRFAEVARVIVGWQDREKSERVSHSYRRPEVSLQEERYELGARIASPLSLFFGP